MRLYFFYALSLVLLLPNTSYSKTYYVDGNSDSFWSDGSKEKPKRTINDGIDLMSSDGGDILIVKPGVYHDDVNFVENGTSEAYNIIKAEKDGTVIIKGQLNLPVQSSYFQFEGLKWDNNKTKDIKGHHLKFLRCAFKGGPASGNTMNVSIGTNDATPGAQHILIEDSWAYGPGGRYNFIVYNSDSVVLRRVIARHDGKWAGSGHDPEAGITVYNSSNVEVQNSMVIDSDEKYQYWESAFYNVKNESSTLPYQNIRITGSIAVNAPYGNGFAFDDYGSMKNVVIENSVAWNTSGGLAMNGDHKHVTAKNLTLGAILGTGAAIWGGNNSRLNISNSLFYLNDNKAIRISAGKANVFNNNCYPRDSYGCGELGTYINPQSSLNYLPALMLNSKLNNKDRQVGASILKQIGKPGSLYGEAGFNKTTSKSLWPWPNEERIRKDLCEDTNRGLCASKQSLTHYIWNQVGNTVPAACGKNKSYEQCLK